MPDTNFEADLLLRGRVRLREDKIAEAELLQYLGPLFRMKSWLMGMCDGLSDDVLHSRCVARVASEEIGHLRYRIAELEAELEKLKGKP